MTQVQYGHADRTGYSFQLQYYEGTTSVATCIYDIGERDTSGAYLYNAGGGENYFHTHDPRGSTDYWVSATSDGQGLTSSHTPQPTPTVPNQNLAFTRPDLTSQAFPKNGDLATYTGVDYGSRYGAPSTQAGGEFLYYMGFDPVTDQFATVTDVQIELTYTGPEAPVLVWGNAVPAVAQPEQFSLVSDTGTIVTYRVNLALANPFDTQRWPSYFTDPYTGCDKAITVNQGVSYGVTVTLAGVRIRRTISTPALLPNLPVPAPTPAALCTPQVLASFPGRSFPWKTSTGLKLLVVSDAGAMSVITPDFTAGRAAFDQVLPVATVSPGGIFVQDLSKEYAYGFSPLSDTKGVFVSQVRGTDAKTLARVCTLTDGQLTVSAPQTIDTMTTAPTRVRRVADDQVAIERQINNPALSPNSPPGFALASFHEVTYQVSDTTLTQVISSGPQYNFFRIASSGEPSISSAHWGGWFQAGGPHGSDTCSRGYAMSAITHVSQGTSAYYSSALLDLAGGAAACEATPYNLNEAPLGVWCDYGADGQMSFGGSAVLPDGRGLALMTFGGGQRRVTYLYEIQPRYSVEDYNALHDDERGLDSGALRVRRWKVPSDQTATAPQTGHVLDAQWYLADPGLADATFDTSSIRMVRRQIDNTRGGEFAYGSSRYDLFQLTLDRNAPPESGLTVAGPGLYLNHDAPGPTTVQELNLANGADGGAFFIGPGQQPLMADLGGGLTLVSLHHSASDGRLNWRFDTDRTLLIGCAPTDSLGVDPGPYIQVRDLGARRRQGSLAFE